MRDILLTILIISMLTDHMLFAKVIPEKVRILFSYMYNNNSYKFFFFT